MNADGTLAPTSYTVIHVHELGETEIGFATHEEAKRWALLVTEVAGGVAMIVAH